MEDETGIIHDQPSSGACEWNLVCELLKDENRDNPWPAIFRCLRMEPCVWTPRRWNRDNPWSAIFRCLWMELWVWTPGRWNRDYPWLAIFRCLWMELHVWTPGRWNRDNPWSAIFRCLWIEPCVWTPSALSFNKGIIYVSLLNAYQWNSKCESKPRRFHNRGA